MSETDRAAKAARAKAMLKKRQQQKAAHATSPSTPDVSTPPRTSTPGPSEVASEDARDLGDVFSNAKDTSDTSWLTSLPRPHSPPAPAPANGTATSPRLTPASSSLAADATALQSSIEKLSRENENLASEVTRLKQYEFAAQQAENALEYEHRRVQELQATQAKSLKDSETALENERRTVSLLVSEKAHLTAELKKLDDAESTAQTLEQLLQVERDKASDLAERASRLQVDVDALSRHAEQWTFREKVLVDRGTELERQLQRASVRAADTGKEAEECKRRLRELEEQIQADDRAERLEVSLRHAQDRADELEFQLTKLKQAHTTLKSERDTIADQLQVTTAQDHEQVAKISTLENSLNAARKSVAELETRLQQLTQDKSSLEQQAQATDTVNRELQDKLAKSTTTNANTTRQLQHSQSEVKNLIRRVEEAEAMQQSLQAEGTDLMRSLEEMRPKIVELTGEKLDLSDKVDSLERALQSRDATIAQLENDLAETKVFLEQSEKVWKDKIALQEKRNTDTQNGVADVQKAYNDLQEELDSALASLRNLESQRGNQHQEASRRLEDIERLTNLSQSQSEELANVKRELDARRKSQEEEQDFLQRAQNEIEGLRGELQARDEEINILRQTVNTPTAEVPRSLDDEMLSSLRQQHALELSSTTSQIRALENTIFDRDSIIHSLQKQLSSLEDQMSHLKSAARVPSRPFSPTHRTNSHNEIRRSSFGHNRPSLPSPLARTVMDQAMSPETLHKRKVSLSMLKARMDSEAKTAGSQVPSRALSPVHSEDWHSRPSSVASHRHSQPHRSQFLDESHVFWCHACTGDLVVL